MMLNKGVRSTMIMGWMLTALACSGLGMETAPVVESVVAPREQPEDITLASAPATPAPATNGTVVGSWMDFTSDAGRFSVKMPVMPAESVESTQIPGMGELQTHMFVSAYGNDAYTIGYADYPSALIGLVPADDVLKGAQEGTIQNVGGTLLDQQTLTVAGKPARQVKTTVPAVPGGVMVSRFFLIENRMYIAVGVFSSEPSAETVNGWLDSFVVK